MPKFDFQAVFEQAVDDSRDGEVIKMRDNLRLVAKKLFTDDQIEDPLLLNLAQEIFKLYAKVLIKGYQDINNYKVSVDNASKTELFKIWKPVTLQNVYRMLGEVDIPTIIKDILAQRQLPTDFQRKNILDTVDQIKTLHGNDLSLEPIRQEVLEIMKPVIDQLPDSAEQIDFKRLVQNTVQEADQYQTARQKYCDQNNIDNDQILNYDSDELANYHQGILNTIQSLV